MNKINSKILLASLILVLTAGLAFTFIFVGNGSAESSGLEYRRGEIVNLGGQDYIFASNKKFVEVLRIAADDQLERVNEIYGMEKVEDLCYSRENNSDFLIVATGKYFIKYNIDNLSEPRIVLKRDLYQWDWHKDIPQYINDIICTNDNIYASGVKGVRRFMKDNLFSDKIYTRDPAYGIAAEGDQLVALLADTGVIYDKDNGNVVAEYPTANTDSYLRKPTFDSRGYVYLVSDNSLLKPIGGAIEEYYNPVKPGDNYSYAAAMSGDEVYYVNGYGISKFDDNFDKTDWQYTAKSSEYGANSWAVNLAVADTDNGNRIAVFNKSSILLMDDGLDVLSQYKLPVWGEQEPLKMELSQDRGSAGNPVTVKLTGYWPNEIIKITFGQDVYKVSADNAGQTTVVLDIPEKTSGNVIVIDATGTDSNLRYQSTFWVF